MNAQPITLTDDEIKELTGYSSAAYQLRVLQELCIPARKRPDNSVLVLRMHCVAPAQQISAIGRPAPRLKSSMK